MESASAHVAVQKHIGTRLITRLMHGWSRLSRGMTLGVKGVVIHPAGEILLVRHTYVPGWHLPGGGVEVGETAEHALVRELSEEVAVTLIGPPRLHGLLLNLNLARRDHVAVFVVEHFAQGRPDVPNREIREIGFFAPHALPEDTTGPTRRRIAEVLGGTPPSPHW
ncbi:NUDIX domain-containing protein [Angulomicrobium tetraedrale]|uniref:NUDIX domain-containing protein n=1 Tax=Ancylobacter tetraedralis TaxID=217068 RepID=UPI001606C60C